MPRDNSNKVSKREQMKRANKQAEAARKKKKNEESDSDDGGIVSDSENEEMDMHEFRKYIQKIFPSKHLDKKIKAGEKVKEIVEKVKDTVKKVSSRRRKLDESESEEEPEDEGWETEDDEPKNKKKSSSSTKKDKRKDVSDDESESIGSEDTNDDDDEDEDDDEADEDMDEVVDAVSKGRAMNIIFTIGGVDENDDEWDDYDEDYVDDEEEDDDETEDEDESVSSDESSDNSSEDEDDDEDEEEDEDEKPRKRRNKKSSDKDKEKGKGKGKEKDKEKDKGKDKEKSEKMNPVVQDNTLAQLKELLAKNPNDKSIKKCIEVYEKDMNEEKERREKKNKKQKAKNMRIFRKILSDKNSMNDFSFYEKLECDYQKKLIKELREINKITRIEKPYRMTLLEADIPTQLKAAAFKKVNTLRYMEPGSGEFYKIKNWVDTFMKIPFTNYQSLPISIEDGVEKCHEFMANAQKTLDDAVYGLDDAKMQIMQLLGQLLTNPKAIGTAIAIHGPPGTGKTSLVKEGISKILNRPFAFIALGGATDSSFLEGHGYTYEGSTWGKIVQILIDSKCMNPVIYFDELDKISDTPRGEEIAGILTHLTDTSQNSQFHDKYFAEVNFDLSKCLFIFSYNDESKVNPILKDRMYRIKTKGYSGKEKNAIAQNYLLPKIREQVKFNDGEILIPDEIVNYINENHCQKEDGVRNLKRCLEIIHTKLNLYRLMRPGSNLFEKEMSIHVKFPFKITKDIVDKLIKKESDGLETWRSLYN